MAHPYHHALSSAKKWGGTVEDYFPIHNWFDGSKEIIADFRHRALRHHAEGIFMAETIFGSTITISTDRIVPVRWIGEQHVLEDLGRIPSFADWARAIRPEAWMGRAQELNVDSTAQAVREGERPLEPNSEIDMAVMIRESLAVMPRLEAQFIQECHLMGKSRKHFATENGLSSQSVADLQGRAFEQLKERLAEKKVRSMGDVL